MDKITSYKKIVKALANEIADLTPPDSQFEVARVLDDEHGHYLLYSLGWQKNYRGYGCFFHVHVRPNGKVYVEHDGTDLVIVDLLEERGVATTDMVLAWHAPSLREETEFAVA